MQPLPPFWRCALFTAGLAISCLTPVQMLAQNRGAAPSLALTPPMGFNTWNRFGCNVSDSLVRQMADAMVARGMRDAGYRYLVIDDCWQVSRDAQGRIVPDPKRFPAGMRALGDYVHGKGLKFGLYTDVGPRTCEGRPGSLGKETVDARSYAEWGVDYLKVDWCHADSLHAPTHYARMRDALAQSGRPIVLSICEWGRNNPWEWGTGIGQLWRITADISDSWQSIAWIIDANARLYPYAGPGHWNDPDMLEVGNGNMSLTEYRSHFSLWAMMAAPLMAGNDLRTMTPAIAEILTNREVIAVNQDSLGLQGRPVIDRGYGVQVWVKPLRDGSRAVALLNLRPDTADIPFRWRDIGIANGGATVRDLWQHEDLGRHVDNGGDYSQRFSQKVPPHGVVMLRVQPAP